MRLRKRLERLERVAGPWLMHLVTDLGGGWVLLNGERCRLADLPADADYTIIREVIIDANEFA